MITDLPFNRSGTSESTDPFIHILFKFISRPKSINTHSTQKMSGTQANAFLCRHKSGRCKRRNPRPKISAGKYARKNIHNGTQSISFMTSMLTVGTQRQQSSPAFHRIGISRWISFCILRPA